MSEVKVKRYRDADELDADFAEMTDQGWRLRRSGSDARNEGYLGPTNSGDVHVDSWSWRAYGGGMDAVAGFNRLKLAWAIASQVIFPGRITVVWLR